MHLSKSKQPNTLLDAHQIHHLIADGGTSGHDHPYSTPTSGYFFSAPSSPMHFVLSSSTFPPPPSSTITPPSQYSTDQTLSGSFDFDFSSHFSPNASKPNESMMSAEELFFNGQIRPTKLSSPSLLDLELEDEQDGNIIIKDSNREDSVVRGRDLSSRNRSHRKTRSVSPLGARHFFWQDEDAFELEPEAVLSVSDENVKCGTPIPSMETAPSCSSSSSRSSSSSGRNSNKWAFLKDLLHRSKSERGSGNNKDRFWPYMITSSPVKEKKLDSSSVLASSSRDEKDKNAEKQRGNKQVRMKKAVAGKPANGVVKRASAHELHYTANRAQAEEMKKKTFLPYRQGLLGCLGFSSKGYGALNGFTKTLNPVSSR